MDHHGEKLGKLTSSCNDLCWFHWHDMIIVGPGVSDVVVKEDHFPDRFNCSTLHHHWSSVMFLFYLNNTMSFQSLSSTQMGTVEFLVFEFNSDGYRHDEAFSSKSCAVSALHLLTWWDPFFLGSCSPSSSAFILLYFVLLFWNHTFT